MAIITISRGTFSGGQFLAECVAGKLGYRCVSGEQVVEASEEYGVSERKLSEAISDAPGVMERLYSQTKRYLACLQAGLMRQVKDENVVYYGRAGHLLLKGVPHVIRVRVVTNMERRLRALTEHSNVSRGQALRLIRRLDRERIRWTRFHYCVNWGDPLLYDLVFNTDQMTIPGACDIVCKMASLSQYQETPESQKLLTDLILSSHLKALILNASSISGRKEVKAEANGGVVTLRGTVGSLMDADKVRELVRKAPGVEHINSQLSVRLFGISPFFY